MVAVAIIILVSLLKYFNWSEAKVLPIVQPSNTSSLLERRE